MILRNESFGHSRKTINKSFDGPKIVTIFFGHNFIFHCFCSFFFSNFFTHVFRISCNLVLWTSLYSLKLELSFPDSDMILIWNVFKVDFFWHDFLEKFRSLEIHALWITWSWKGTEYVQGAWLQGQRKTLIQRCAINSVLLGLRSRRFSWHVFGIAPIPINVHHCFRILGVAIVIIGLILPWFYPILITWDSCLPENQQLGILRNACDLTLLCNFDL